MAERALGRNIYRCVEASRAARYKSAMTVDSPAFSRSVALADLPATASLAAQIAAGLARGDAVALHGDLGTGKTTLARAILRSLGVDESVPSPTFTLVQSYATPGLTVHHYDLYRLKSPREMDELGFEEALEDGAVLIEWPERAGDRIPADALQVALSVDKSGMRRASLSGPARWLQVLS